MYTPERIVFVSNPVSAHADKAAEYRDKLIRTGIPVVAVETDKDPRQTAGKLTGALGSSALLALAGGDGTVHDVVGSLLLTPELAGWKNTPILCFPCGNSNDVAGWVNSRRALRHPEKVLLHALVVPVTPLTCHIREPHAETQCRTILAIAYASLGASATAAAELEKTRPARLRSLSTQLHAGRTVMGALKNAQPFILQTAEGTTEKRYEEVVANTPTVAGFLRMPYKPADRLAHVTRIREKDPYILGEYIGRSLVGRAETYVLSGDELLEYHLLSDTDLQCDGQAHHLPAGTHVTIGFHNAPFYAATTNTALYAR